MVRSRKGAERAGSSHPASIEFPRHWALTGAESEVVSQLILGQAPAAIAVARGISVHTIRTHLKRAMAKAGVHTQAALVARVYSTRR